MEEKKMTEKESLELISQMITKGRVRLEKQVGWPVLLWGLATAAVGVAVWASVKATGDLAWHYLWFTLLIGFPIHWAWNKKHVENVRDYLFESVGWVWCLFGALCMLLTAVTMFGCNSFPIQVCIALMLGFSSAVTGILLKRWLVVVIGLLSICVGVPLVFAAAGVDMVLVMSGMVLLNVTLPGAIMCFSRRGGR